MGWFDFDFEDVIDVIAIPIAVTATAVATPYIVAKELYDYATEDDYETSTYDDRQEREAELKEAAKKERKIKIYKDIEKYKNKQIKRIKDKYNVDIKFNTTLNNNLYIASIELSPLVGTIGVEVARQILNSDIVLNEKISIYKSNEVGTIATLEKETEEMIKLIGKLEVRKYETTS